MELTTRIAGKCTTDQGIITATNTPRRTIVRVPLRQTTPTSRSKVAHEEDNDYRTCELRDHGDRPVVPTLTRRGTTIFFLHLFLTWLVPATPFPLTAESAEPDQTTNPSPPIYSSDETNSSVNTTCSCSKDHTAGGTMQHLVLHRKRHESEGERGQAQWRGRDATCVKSLDKHMTGRAR